MNTPKLGWITPAKRTADMHDGHARSLARMPRTFRITGSAPDPGPYVNLMELWKHPQVVSALGYEYSGTHQLTGSCVGAGGGNVQFTLSAIEVIRLNDPEQIILPFWLYTYGISRMLLGETSEGEGSLGSTFAEASKTYGVFSNAENGLPQPQNSDGLIWGESVEMKWSNGKAIASNWTALGKKHLIRTTTPLKSAAEVRDAIRNGYPVTFACDRYITPGNERVKGSGENACSVGKYDGDGGHQTSLLGSWDNPELGPMLYDPNQWGLNTYILDPKTGRKIGTWVTHDDVDYAIKHYNAEVYAFSQFDGYPAQTLKLSSINDF